MNRPRAVPTLAILATLAMALCPLASHEAAAQTRRIRPEHNVRTYEVVLQLPGMDRAAVRRDLPYKTAAGRSLMIDI